MIKSFGDKFTEQLFNRQVVLKWKGIEEIARKKLEMLHATTDLKQLRAVPGNQLRKLEGNLKDYYRIWINKQYRLLFQWKNPHAYQVSISKHYQ